jgi:hypothetical protein
MNAVAVRVALPCALALLATQVGAANHDFNGDGHDDVVWRQATMGANLQWRSGDRAGSVALTAVSNAQWKIVGAGDFDGDGRADLLWRNAADGRNAIWRSANASMPRAVSALVDTRWQVVGVGDFDGDRRSDILWQHPTSGFVIWPAALSGSVRRLNPLQLVGIADLDGDGRDDLVGRTGLYFPSAFRFYAWSGADETHVVELGIVSAYDMTNWTLQAVGDFDGDRHDDLFWRNRADGRNMAWRAGVPANTFAVARVGDVDWNVAAAGDFDRDGRSDLFWRHRSSDGVSVWSAANYRQGHYLGRVSAHWSVAP